MNVKMMNVSKYFDVAGTRVTAVDSVSMDINTGDFVALVGHTGSGKTTLLSLMGTIMHPSKGAIYYDNAKVNDLPESALIDARRMYTAFIFQYPELITNLSVLENILIPYIFKGPVTEQTEEEALGFLRRLSLAKKAHMTPQSLSGGEQKKVAIVRAVMYKPQILLADEPTSDLDPESSAEVMKIFAEINRAGVSIVMVTHAMDLARAAKNIYELEYGKIVRCVK